MALKKKSPFQIKRPGALTRRAKSNDQSVTEQARTDVRSGTPLQKKQSNLFLSVFKPAAAKRRKKRSLLA